MAAEKMPAAEFPVDETLVRRLLSSQHPDLAELPLALLANGWDNVMYRLGRDLIVRLPRRRAAADLIEHEQRWLPLLAPRLPLPIPAPMGVGRPGCGYPWAWSVVPWIAGEVAARVVLKDQSQEALRLASFVAALHQPAPSDAPANPFRGGPLIDRVTAVTERTARLAAIIDVPKVLHCWDELVATQPWPGPSLWLHGDLHSANVVVADGAIVTVVDFGDITSGDPATDLAVAWMLFDRDSRAVFRSVCGTTDDDTWARARGWALHFSLAYLANSADNPLMASIGTSTLDAVLND